MHDFNELFKEQLTNELPYTKGMVNSTLHLMSHTMTPREIMVKSKELKAKIGKKRVMYYLVARNADGSPKTAKILKVWEDDFEQLQNELAEYNFVGYEGRLPKFAHKDLK